jgi:hypothetical protein
MSVAINSAGNNIMLAGIGAGHRIDSHTIAVPSGVVSPPLSGGAESCRC